MAIGNVVLLGFGSAATLPTFGFATSLSVSASEVGGVFTEPRRGLDFPEEARGLAFPEALRGLTFSEPGRGLDFTDD